MEFKNLRYVEKIAVADIFFRENLLKSDQKDFMPTKIYMSFKDFVFETKASGTITCKIFFIQKFFEENTKIIRKAKIFEINKNLSLN